MDFYRILQNVTIEFFMEEMSFTKQISTQLTCFDIFHNFHLIVISCVEWCNEPLT